MTRQVWQVRLSEAEDAAFRAAAREAGLDRAGLFRARVLGVDPPLAPSPPSSAVEAVGRVNEATRVVVEEELLRAVERVSGSEKASESGEGPASPREPNVMVLANAMGTRDISAARRALADGSWKRHMK